MQVEIVPSTSGGRWDNVESVVMGGVGRHALASSKQDVAHVPVACVLTCSFEENKW